MLRSIDAFVDEVLDEALHATPGADEFKRILAVMPARATPGGGAPQLRVGRRAIPPRAVLRHLLNVPHGVFLEGASRQEARQWVQRLAHQLHGKVREDRPHRGGLPHFHVDHSAGSTGHIFYGRPPSGLFFED